jgi:hypothetical protein
VIYDYNRQSPLGLPPQGGCDITKEFQYLNDKDIVLIRVTGSYLLSAEADTVKKISFTLKEHNCRKLLLDFRAANIIAKTMDIFDRPKVYSNEGIEQSIKAAILCKEINNDFRFYETVCLNRGWEVKIFDDYNISIDWLTK